MNVGVLDANGYVGYEVVATNIGNRVVATNYIGLGYYEKRKCSNGSSRLRGKRI